MTVQITDWPHDGVGIERGPLVFSLPVPATTNVVTSYVAREKRRSTEAFPAFEYFPAGDWNYGLPVVSAKDVEVISREATGWKLVAEGEGGAPATPGFPAARRPGRREPIELVPYGATLLRVTVFPRLPAETAKRQREPGLGRGSRVLS